MNVNGIGKQNFYENANKTKANTKGCGSGFYESLSENLGEKQEAEPKKESVAFPAGVGMHNAYPYRNMPAKADAGVSDIHESGSVAAGAVSECEARGISYQESDYVKVFAKEGFSLMAQVDMKTKTVYIEQKKEDGTYQGYEVNVDKLDKDTLDPIEQAALEAWEKESAESEDELTIAEALQAFYEFIEDRIKNGPPKYLIGNAEYSIAEWDKLIEGIDGQLDEIREELRERIEKVKEQMLKADAAGELEELKDGVREAQSEEIEEKLLMSLFQDMGK